MTKIIYYMKNSSSPVKDFIDSLDNKQKAKIFRIFQYIEVYGLLSVLPHVKRLSGIDLWEIRILGKDNIRIIYVTLTSDSIVVLHGFIKKTQKTSSKDLNIALERRKNLKLNIEL